MNTWYVKYGIIAIASASGLFLYETICWAKIDGSVWASWVQAIGSIAAVIAAFLVADRQFQMSRREARITAKKQTIARIQVLGHAFLMIKMEIGWIEAAFHYGDTAIVFDSGRILELRRMLSQIPILDVPTVELAISVAAIPAAIDTALKVLAQVHEAAARGVPVETMERLHGDLRNSVRGLSHMCQLAISRGEEVIEAVEDGVNPA